VGLAPEGSERGHHARRPNPDAIWPFRCLHTPILAVCVARFFSKHTVILWCIVVTLKVADHELDGGAAFRLAPDLANQSDYLVVARPRKRLRVWSGPGRPERF
jgi:hypothetical protein